jgi:DNA adenine methylase
MKTILPFPWYGGKASHLGWLLPLIDGTPHQTYVEPFGGSAAVLLNKAPSPVEVYNDLYEDVVNFFRVLRDNRDELIARLELTPYSRDEFAAACSRPPESGVECARQFFIVARQVRTGLATTASPGRWAYAKEGSRRGMSQTTSRWLSSIDGLADVCERLRTVQIECLDALDVLSRYDTPGTLSYVDPPYVMDTRSGGKAYKLEFGDDLHTKLLDTLKGLKGRVILSGYAGDLYAEALKDWHVYEPPAKRSGASKDFRQEVVWTNFEPVRKAA